MLKKFFKQITPGAAWSGAVDPDPHLFSLLDPDPHSIYRYGSRKEKSKFGPAPWFFFNL